MPKSNEQELLVNENEDKKSSDVEQVPESKEEKPEMDTGLSKELDAYRKLIEKD